MKAFKKLPMLAFIGMSIILGSCKKETPEPEPEPQPLPGTGVVEVKLSHVWGDAGEPFNLNSDFVHPVTGDTLNFYTLKYYVSNLQLKNADGTWWTQPESYYLVDLTDAGSTTLSIPDVPEGNYTEISYLMGVDSLRNVSGAQSGALSTTHGMFWSWSSGYIMLKAEGTSPNSNSGSFSYHLGGFSWANNILKTRIATFGSDTLQITAAKNSQIHLELNPANLFNTIGSVSTLNMIHMPGSNAKAMAGDFFGTVVFDHLVN